MKKKRTPLRTSFTKFLYILKAQFKGSSDKGTILRTFSKLKNVCNDIKTINDSIIHRMAEDKNYNESTMDKIYKKLKIIPMHFSAWN